LRRAAQGPVLRSLIGLLVPDVITSSPADDACGGGRHRRALEEHRAVFEAIRSRDEARAGAAMLEHMRKTQQQHSRSRKRVR